ncbi:MAG: transcription termination factor Rho, partial [Verrucomicrobiales bacterium]|nr:transcription termination factor Rho [Verrucomicrobiales bacterium]
MTEEIEENAAKVAAEEKEKKTISVPETVDINDFQMKTLNDLHKAAQDVGLRVAGIRSKHQLIFEILQVYGKNGTTMSASGFLDYSGDNFGFLRWPEFSFLSNAEDVYVPANLIRKSDLRPGQLLKCHVRAPRDREKYLSVESIIEIEGIPFDEWETPNGFDNLTALFPSERIILETSPESSGAARVMDLVSPLGKGQRGLIVAPPRGGKTILLKNIAVSISKNHPEVELIVLLLDERPEEVTDFKETVEAAVYSSTFDEAAVRHIQVADMVLNRAKRLVEMGKDVVILLDSLTRLARGHNSANQSGAPQKGKKGRGGRGGPIGTGGISPKALERSRRFFGAARNVEEGGSLTIVATCLIETDSKMDEVIFEEFKGTGNSEVV